MIEKARDDDLTHTQRLAVAMATTWHQIAAEDNPDWSEWNALVRAVDSRVHEGRRVDIAPAELYASLCALVDWCLKALESSSSDVDVELLLHTIGRAFATDA